MAGVDGTLVTRAKVVTAGAIEAIEKLHDRQGALRAAAKAFGDAMRVYGCPRNC